MPSDATHSDLRRSSSRLWPLAGVSAAGVLFAVLLILVRTRWGPMESVDHGLATHLNNLVAGHSVLVAIIKKITWLGSSGVLVTAVVAGIVITAVRRRFRLALYLVITCVGELVLDPVLKSLVGRVRPIVPTPISHGTGNSFPSGHSLGSIVCYGALLLVFLPAVPQRFRVLARTLVAVLIGAIGISRILLGVHYLSDVIGAWALGVAWLGLTAYAFELMRQETHRPVTQPLVEGLEPEAEADLETDDEPTSQRHPGRAAAALAIVWVLTLGIIVGIGELIMHSGNGNGNLLGDHTVTHWLAAHRTPGLTRWSALFSSLGATQVVLIVILTAGVLAYAIGRSWRPVIFIATLMTGELVLFLVTAAIVKRPRPDVKNLDARLPTFAYPSGHVAATLCIWIAIAILVIGAARGWWRWLFLAPAIVMPILVASSRMYRGEHHPTDVLGSLLFAAIWIPAVYALVRPLHRASPRTPAEPAEPSVREAVPV